MGINRRYKKFAEALENLDLNSETYTQDLNALKTHYNLNLDGRQKALGRVALTNDLLQNEELVKKMMRLNRRRDTLYNFQDFGELLLENIPQTLQHINSIFHTPNPNINNQLNTTTTSSSTNVLMDTHNLLSNMSLSGQPEGLGKIGEARFAQQGMKIQYLDLFK